MSGIDLGYAEGSWECLDGYHPQVSQLCIHAYVGTHAVLRCGYCVCVCGYPLSTENAGMLIPGRCVRTLRHYGLPRYLPTPHYAMPGTDLAYGATTRQRKGVCVLR
eukprot:3941121-Rhodomonas_salina.2